MGDIMKNSLIKQESKAFIKGKRIKALFIVLFPLIFCVLMTALTIGIIFVSDLLRNAGLGFTIAIFAVLVILSFAALLIYSSVSVGEKAWYGGITANKKNYTKRLFFWFRPEEFPACFLLQGIIAYRQKSLGNRIFPPGGNSCLVGLLSFRHRRAGAVSFYFLDRRSSSAVSQRSNILFHCNAKVFHRRISLLIKPETRCTDGNKTK